MRRVFVAVSKFVFNLLYKLFSLKGRREHVILFLSRQANIPSYDYVTLAREFERRGWTAVIHVKKLSKRTALSYVGHVLREIRLLARCQVAVVDRYDPILSLIDFKCESPDSAAGYLHHEFPVEPMVLQLWHAFGAYKKFGYQSVGTREGHTREVTDTFNIHRNYSWVVCSGEGCRQAFAEAFACPVDRVVALNRPEFDELALMADQPVDGAFARSGGTAAWDAAPHIPGVRTGFKGTADVHGAASAESPEALSGDASGAPERGAAPDSGPEAGAASGRGGMKVLMAPTLRKSKASVHPFRELYERRDELEDSVDSLFEWSFHPLEDGLPAPGNVSSRLRVCDVVVTDYSSIVYEAFVLGKKVLFYTPDLQEYRRSPGLNSDPQLLCPSIVAHDEAELAGALKALAENPESYDRAALNTFCAKAFDIGGEADVTPVHVRIADFVESQVNSSN